jgi:cell division protein FtsI/penicillin-binding protein 2
MLKTLPVPVAGKTGTAQFGPNNEFKHAWFTTFAPYDNPQIEMVILLDSAGEGSSFAEPVANEVLKWYFWGRK